MGRVEVEMIQVYRVRGASTPALMTANELKVTNACSRMAHLLEDDDRVASAHRPSSARCLEVRTGPQQGTPRRRNQI